MKKEKCVRLIKIIYFIWLVLVNSLLLADVMSYYYIMGNSEDVYHIINRDANVVFIHVFFGIPYIIALIILGVLFTKKDFKP